MHITQCVPVDEARKRLKCTRQHVHRLIRDGRLPGTINWYGVKAIPAQAIEDHLLLLAARRARRAVEGRRS